MKRAAKSHYGQKGKQGGNESRQTLMNFDGINGMCGKGREHARVQTHANGSRGASCLETQTQTAASSSSRTQTQTQATAAGGKHTSMCASRDSGVDARVCVKASEQCNHRYDDMASRVHTCSQFASDTHTCTQHTTKDCAQGITCPASLHQSDIAMPRDMGSLTDLNMCTSQPDTTDMMTSSDRVAAARETLRIRTTGSEQSARAIQTGQTQNNSHQNTSTASLRHKLPFCSGASQSANGESASHTRSPSAKTPLLLPSSCTGNHTPTGHKQDDISSASSRTQNPNDSSASALRASPPRVHAHVTSPEGGSTVDVRATEAAMRKRRDMLVRMSPAKLKDNWRQRDVRDEISSGMWDECTRIRDLSLKQVK
jgi:hypothetical protein